jgi:uncharacterized membrane protein
VVSTSPVASASPWDKTTVVELSGEWTGSTATAISGDGTTIVGYAHVAGDTRQRAVRWTVGEATVLPTTKKAQRAHADQVSFDGSVIVGAYAKQENDDVLHYPVTPVQWVNGKLKTLALPKRVTSAEASYVSSDGRVVVGQAFGPCGEHLCTVRWTDRKGVVVGGKQGSWPTAVSGDGKTVVVSGSTRIGDTSDELESAKITAMTRDGTVLVDNYVTPRLRRGTTMTPLSAPKAYPHCTAEAIADDAQRIVGYCTDEHYRDQVAVIWAASGDVRLLSQALVDAKVGVADWKLRSATAISADGTTITGEGVTGTRFVAFVAVLP